MKKTNEQDKNQESNNSLIKDLKELLTYITPRRRVQMIFLLLLMILSSLSEMISVGSIFPFLRALSNPETLLNNSKLQSILKIFGIANSTDLVTKLAIIFIIAVVVANSLRLLTLNYRIRFASALGADISNEAYHKTIRQPYSFHLTHNSSDLIQTVSVDTDSLTQSVLNPLVAFLNDILIVPSLIITLMLIDGVIAFTTALIIGGAYVLIYRTRQKLLKRNSKIVTESGQKKIKIVQEGIGGIRDILLSKVPQKPNKTSTVPKVAIL
ncbi:ABC transporter transmembrane domain-containing protein [Geminocystis sp. CENA526]|uniref:ABC transporter transmembrane domain-containing protein n=1 Tax=Geminocystis sp. CENA526 TaxID=1355871 RepID=UPI003D6DDAA1